MSMATDNEDEVEILSVNGRPIELSCEVCHVSLTEKSVPERQAHYDEHFDQIPDRPGEGSSRIIDLSTSRESDQDRSPSVNFRKKRNTKDNDRTRIPSLEKQNAFWFQTQDAPAPQNFTPGLIPVIKQALLSSHSKGKTVRAALCYAGVVHVGTELRESGWGCGYRNFLMACTALMDQRVQPLYFPALDGPSSPGVRNLQQWIEDAWQAGYDPEGAAELKNKLVGTRKWIGTAELHVAYLSRGIPSNLVDFPRVDKNATAVVDWVVSYFSEPSLDASDVRLKAKVKTTVDEALRGASPVVLTDRMPLVLQHKGHSRTIIGYERTKDGSVNLLCFDPSRRPPSVIRNAALQRFYSSRIREGALVDALNIRKRHHGASPSGIISSVLHSWSCIGKEGDLEIDTNVRKRGSDHTGGRDSKRPRGGLHVPKAGPITGGSVIEISDDDDEIMDTEPVPRPSSSKSPLKHTSLEVEDTKVLNFFQLKPKKVGERDRYQILYFPLEGPLTEQQRWERRIVTSEVVH